jgi:SAM-dependent methyltransferase
MRISGGWEARSTRHPGLPVYKDSPGCRACGSTHRIEILAFGEMPLSDGLLSESQLKERELRFPLTFLFCPDCSLVQIRETVDPEVLFGADYPYFSSFSDSWLRHCRENVTELMDSRKLGASSLVVEIASNDGYLLRNYVERGVAVLGIDPAPGPAAAARQRGVPVLEAFFGRALAESLAANGTRADVIHANNVLAHVADLQGVVDGIRVLLKDDGIAVIEVPYVRDLIDHCEFDTIYHEHLCYFSVTAVSRLFARHGLTLVDAHRLPTHGGSLRLFAQPTGSPSPAVEQLLAEETRLGLDSVNYYTDFATRVRAVQRSLTELLRSLKSNGMRIAGYAAAAKGAILLNSSGIDGQLLDYVVDRNCHKHGKYMPGVHLPIYDTTRLLESPIPDYVLVLAWNFKDEVMRQQSEYRSRGGQFIVPIPTPQIAGS